MTPQHSSVRPLLLDGGFGRELNHRSVELSRTVWSAAALLKAPQIVKEIHLDYINAGADIITTNTFSPIPKDWMLDGAEQNDGLLPYRKDLDPESYVSHVCKWLDAGATVVGGCCGTRPVHTERMRQCIDIKYPPLP